MLISYLAIHIPMLQSLMVNMLVTNTSIGTYFDILGVYVFTVIGIAVTFLVLICLGSELVNNRGGEMK